MDAVGTIRPDRMATTGTLSEPAIPASPQAAGPAVPERGIAPGGVSGCSAMPGTGKTQPAPVRARGFRGQDSVERHAGLDAVREKTDHSREVIEAALAHVVRNPVEAAYARSDLFERRRWLMDDWAGYLAGGSRGAGRPVDRP